MKKKINNESIKKQKQQNTSKQRGGKKVQTLSDSTLRRKPSTRKRVLQRAPTINRIVEKRKELMEAINETVTNCQDFKKKLHAMTGRYPLVVALCNCGSKEGKHAVVHHISRSLSAKLMSRHLADVALPILEDKKLVSPYNGTEYYPVPVEAYFKSFWDKVGTLISGKKGMSYGNVTNTIEKGFMAYYQARNNYTFGLKPELVKEK